MASIQTLGGHYIFVKETYDEIKDKIKNNSSIIECIECQYNRRCLIYVDKIVLITADVNKGVDVTTEDIAIALEEELNKLKSKYPDLHYSFSWNDKKNSIISVTYHITEKECNQEDFYKDMMKLEDDLFFIYQDKCPLFKELI